MIKKIFLITAPLLLILSGCGGNQSTQSADTGSIAFSVEWRGTAAASSSPGISKAQLDCNASGIATVEAAVYDGPTLAASGGPWSCSAHAGSITNVPPANNYKVTITGKDASGNMAAYGELSGLSVLGGQTTNAGAISVSAIATIATGQNKPYHITTDGTNVYWTEYDNGNGAVKKTGINGGTVTPFASGLNTPNGIAVDASNVYWTEQGGSKVSMVSLNGGTPTTLASYPTYPTMYNPMGIAVDSTDVYWITSIQPTGALWKVPISGGTATTIVTGLNNPYSIAVDSTSVYWTEQNGGTVKKASKDGMTVTTLASGQSAPYELAIDTTNVYWGLFSGGGVAKVGIGGTGGTVTTLAAGGTPNIYGAGIAVDATNVYWVESTASTGTIKKVGINGGTVTTLAPNMNFSFGLAADATSVYWTEQNVGNIKKVFK